MRRLFAVAALIISFSAHADESDIGNVRFDPLNLIFGSINVDLDFKINPNWTVGPAFLYARYNIASNAAFYQSYDVTAWGIGARANWFYNGAFTTGFYVGPALKYESFKVTTTDSAGAVTGTAAPILIGCVAGYAWFWDNFNIMVGGGADLSLGATNITIKDSNGNSYTVYSSVGGLALEGSLGWTF